MPINYDVDYPKLERKYSEALNRVAYLEKAIKDFVGGDYPNPRSMRPNDCPHGIRYWQECTSCDDEYWTSVMDIS